MTLAIPNEANRRVVLRAFKTDAILATANGGKPIFLVSLTEESMRKTMHTYALPVLAPVGDAEVKQIEQNVIAAPGTTTVVGTRPDGGGILLVTAP
jgi:hypothetical protein